ncbi:LuxR C-terminal-related transcriptional regulator [Streptomyces sp. NPDC002588]|uniref:LuxR family transcriptional regulator AbsR2 n=1 Tax=Streptomyces sp. NPDC002588 TaxID=3154419 RepID=UPI0033220933
MSIRSPDDVTTIDTRARTLRLPWPFTGREEELELVRRSLTAGRPGIVVTGPAGCGRTRLATEAVRGTGCARVAGTPETRGSAFAAFAHLLPEGVTLHRAVQLLSDVRLLLVDDAQLLDDASAALLHQLAVHGRTRLLVVVADGSPAPSAVTRLWTGELLPRLALEPLSAEDTVQLLTAGAGAPPEPLTVNRLHGLCRGDLRLLRDLLAAVRDEGLLTPVPDGDEWAWRGPVPPTPTLRERTAHLFARPCPDERETLDRLAFAEPLPLPTDTLDLRVLERLETDGLIEADDDESAVRLAHPLYGPVLRAAAGRLRAGRLTRARGSLRGALETETAALVRAVEDADVRTRRTPVGEWLVAEGEPVPPAHAAVRARFSRLRGELREAAAWAREGLAQDGKDTACRHELMLAAVESGERTTAPPPPVVDTREAVPALDGCETYHAYGAVRLGDPGRAVGLLPPGSVFARHAQALARADGAALDRVAGELAERGFLLFAAEAHAQAVRAHRDPTAARTARTRAVALARRCQGARTPALAGLVLGELTARQQQIVALAAAGLSNRQIAERLTLSVRTVGNHLYGAYTRLGACDRAALPWLTGQPA